MKRTLSRLFAVAVALPLTVGVMSGTASASHGATVPGCYGAGTNQTVICNLTVSVGVPVGAETYQTTVPVCVGTCQQVPVTLARTTPGEPVVVCYSYNTLGGPTVGNCYDVVGLANQWIDYVRGAVDNAVDSVGELAYRVCRSVQNALENRDLYVISCD